MRKELYRGERDSNVFLKALRAEVRKELYRRGGDSNVFLKALRAEVRKELYRGEEIPMSF